MRLPLILGAEPKKFSNNARVLLTAGSWCINCENIKDSVLILSALIGQPPTLSEWLIKPQQCIEITGPTIVKVTIEKPGSESYIAVFAELQ